MNLYLLTQTHNDAYDTFDSLVVASKNSDLAQKIHPYGELDESAIEYEEKFPVWAEPHHVKVFCIGVAKSQYKEGEVILSSYNAG